MNRVNTVSRAVKIRNCIISVSDKTGLDYLVKGLLGINPSITLYSTGGTFSFISDVLSGEFRKNLRQISSFTGQPEMQGGLVKTLDFKIYLGILSEPGNEAHTQDIARVKGVEFDMVVVNLYPFGDVIKKPETTLEDARSHIDIGGPCMLRASAKNFLRLASVCDPSDYRGLLDELKTSDGCLSLSTRFALAKKTFSHTAAYDKAIAEFLLAQPAEITEQHYTLF
ncbi:MAG: hypothetical protein E4H36_05140 [Spirochaetales bacterium]|nr:MAG: hypothetical protein E4H36_05140 [Spirochaetales bacterium]